MSIETARAEYSACERVVQKIAGREGVDETDLTPPLNKAIDCDALNSLFSGPPDERDHTSLKIAFEYRGYRVLVTGETVRLTTTE